MLTENKHRTSSSFRTFRDRLRLWRMQGGARRLTVPDAFIMVAASPAAVTISHTQQVPIRTQNAYVM